LTSRCTIPAAWAWSSAAAVQPAQRLVAGDRLTGAQAVGDRAARKVLHHDERAVGVLADVVDRDDVRMIRDPRGGAGLALEARPRALVDGVVRRQQLDGHPAAQEEVLGGPHGGHPAVGDVLSDLVAVGQRDLRGRGHPESRYPALAAGNRPGRLPRLMAKVCHSCGKGPAFGHSRSHSMVATKRRFDPNLQKVRVLVGAAPRRVYVCTRCLKAGKVTKAV
jgi:large subunit ribosomal protein L28